MCFYNKKKSSSGFGSYPKHITLLNLCEHWPIRFQTHSLHELLGIVLNSKLVYKLYAEFGTISIIVVINKISTAILLLQTLLVKQVHQSGALSAFCLKFLAIYFFWQRSCFTLPGSGTYSWVSATHVKNTIDCCKSIVLYSPTIPLQKSVDLDMVRLTYTNLWYCSAWVGGQQSWW